MSTNTHVTHPYNKSTHPGVPDIDEEVMSRPVLKPRRTKAQIIADNIAAAEKKSTKSKETKINNEKKAHLVTQIAKLDKEMLDDEQQDNKEAACPQAPVKKRLLMTKSPTKCMNLSLFKCVMY